MKRLLPIILMIVCVPWCARAQDAGTRSPFQFGFGARDLALGSADLAGGDAVTAPFWNASRLARAEHTQFSLFHSRLFDNDVAYQYLGVAVPTLDIGTFGLGIARLGVDGIERRDAGNVLLGHTSDDRLGLFLAYGKVLAGYDVGMTVSIEHHQLDGYSATSSPGVDLNVTRRFFFNSPLWRGLAVSIGGTNLVQPTTDLSTEAVTLPTHFGGGVTLDLNPAPRHPLRVHLSARVDESDRSGTEQSLGMEFDVAGRLQLRAGLRHDHPAAGAGLTYRAMAFDYAVIGRDLGTIHAIAITTSLGRAASERRRRREEHREHQFNQLMSERLQARNTELIATLITTGDSAMSAGSYGVADQTYDRALFMARSDGADTAAVAEKLARARQASERADRAERYGRLVDSAATAFGREDFLTARYYADQALAANPGGTEANEWRTRADNSLEERANRKDLMQHQLEVIDSLVNQGQTEAAIISITALRAFAPQDEEIARAIKRVHFEHYRARANMARVAGQGNRAAVMLDSARAYFPDHQWCREFAAQLQSAARPGRTETKPSAQKTPISEDLLREAKAAYEDGQDAFRSGDLATAIGRWESAERLVPDYESVRPYLVKAYRLVGIDYYGRNQLEDALDTWRRARELDPQNAEINAFITRTEAELLRIKELSYDDR